MISKVENFCSSWSTYRVFWEQLVLCTVLRRRKNHFKNQNSCFFFQNQEALVCKPLFSHVSNAFSQQPLSYWQTCYSLNLSETRTLIRCERGGSIQEGAKFESHSRVFQEQLRGRGKGQAAGSQCTQDQVGTSSRTSQGQ